jgi:trans-2-enoyl-CoA reductase
MTDITKTATNLGIKITLAPAGSEIWQRWADKVRQAQGYADEVKKLEPNSRHLHGSAINHQFSVKDQIACAAASVKMCEAITAANAAST